MKSTVQPRLVAMLVLAAAGLAACASQTIPNIYTLQRQELNTPAVQGGPTRFIDVAPVVIPERLRRKQVVVRTGPTQLKVLEQERWSSSLADELHDSISVGLQNRLGAADVSQTGLAGKAPSYRISIEFNQLDAEQGGQVRATVSWLVKQVSGDQGRVCQAQFAEPAGTTIEDLVAAHQRVVSAVADAVAVSQRALESNGPAPFCASSARN